MLVSRMAPSGSATTTSEVAARPLLKVFQWATGQVRSLLAPPGRAASKAQSRPIATDAARKDLPTFTPVTPLLQEVEPPPSEKTISTLRLPIRDWLNRHPSDTVLLTLPTRLEPFTPSPAVTFAPKEAYSPPEMTRYATRYGGGYPEIWELSRLVQTIRRPYLLRLDLARVQPSPRKPIDELLAPIPDSGPVYLWGNATPFLEPLPPLEKAMAREGLERAWVTSISHRSPMLDAVIPASRVEEKRIHAARGSTLAEVHAISETTVSGGSCGTHE